MHRKCKTMSPVHQHAGFCGAFATGPSLGTFATSFRGQRFGFRGGTLYCQGLWRCSSEQKKGTKGRQADGPCFGRGRKGGSHSLLTNGKMKPARNSARPAKHWLILRKIKGQGEASGVLPLCRPKAVLLCRTKKRGVFTVAKQPSRNPSIGFHSLPPRRVPIEASMEAACTKQFQINTNGLSRCPLYGIPLHSC